MKIKHLLIVSLLCLLTLQGCLYKMPGDDCISTLPNTNNPTLTRETPPSLIPGKG
ncbi:MAG: hypothetical protein K940chlam2_01799 [Chlamydiae bacterium]|nr:hypothetical protein [Chlamydiota bacterium]